MYHGHKTQLKLRYGLLHLPLPMGIITHLRRSWLVDACFGVCQKGWIRLWLLMGSLLHGHVYVKADHQIDRDDSKESTGHSLRRGGKLTDT